MSRANEVFDKVMNLPLRDLLILCSTAIDSKMEEKRLDALLLALETRLQKRRIMASFNIKSDGNV